MFKTKTVFPYKGTDLVVSLGNYESGRKAIMLYDAFSGEAHSCPTADVNGLDIKFNNEVLVKDYSENEGMLKFLIENNIVTWTGRTVASGFIELYICTLNSEELWNQPDNFITF
jgi:sulfate adenylyltransferase subunit 1 (EFTu-like GTPase family)